MWERQGQPGLGCECADELHVCVFAESMVPGAGQNETSKLKKDLVCTLRLFGQIGLRTAVYGMPIIGWSQLITHSAHLRDTKTETKEIKCI